MVPKLLDEDDVNFDLSKIDFSEVKEGWNNKVIRVLVNTAPMVSD